MKNPFIIWYGAATDPSGYGEATRNYILGLDDIGDVDFKLNNRSFWHGEKLDISSIFGRINKLASKSIPKDADDVSIVFNLTPENYFVQSEIKRFVCVTTFETSGLPQHWLMPMRAMDLVITYSQFNKETFRNSGITNEIAVVPHGVDTDKYNPNTKPLEVIKNASKGRFVFGSNFDWNERKNPKALIKAYYKAFSNKSYINDVLLALKVYHQFPIQKSIENIKRNIANIKAEMKFPKYPKILLINDIIDVDHMANFYSSLDCFVLPSRGEGWGLTFSEAMSTGLPTIGTNWSGNTEFMNRDNSYLLDYELVKISPDTQEQRPFYGGHYWADIKEEQLAEYMMEIFNNQEKAVEKGKRARQDMVEKWTWKIACQKMNSVLTGL